MVQPVVRGLVAGAAGTCALNVLTYLDMAGRGRPSSSMPADAAGKIADGANVNLGEAETADNRREGGGALLGYATGLAVGVGYGLIRSKVRVALPVAALGLTVAAMAGSDAPLTAMGLTDPRSWPASSWLADLIPHIGYGVAAAATYQLFDAGS